MIITKTKSYKLPMRKLLVSCKQSHSKEVIKWVILKHYYQHCSLQFTDEETTIKVLSDVSQKQSYRYEQNYSGVTSRIVKKLSGGGY